MNFKNKKPCLFGRAFNLLKIKEIQSILLKKDYKHFFLTRAYIPSLRKDL